MNKAAKDFLKSTTTKMDEILAALTPEEQHDLRAVPVAREALHGCVRQTSWQEHHAGFAAGFNSALSRTF
jgi:hypothetical protein